MGRIYNAFAYLKAVNMVFMGSALAMPGAHDGGEAHGGVISESMLNHIMMKWAVISGKPISASAGPTAMAVTM